MYFQNACNDVYRTAMQQFRVYMVLIKTAVKNIFSSYRPATSAINIFTHIGMFEQ